MGFIVYLGFNSLGIKKKKKKREGNRLMNGFLLEYMYLIFKIGMLSKEIYIFWTRIEFTVTNVKSSIIYMYLLFSNDLITFYLRVIQNESYATVLSRLLFLRLRNRCVEML